MPTEALAAHREAINRLNVYPVPDGDTGTNMSLTLVSVCDDLDAAGDGLVDVCKAVSHGSLMGARGSSGVILSQVLRGLVGVIAEAGGCDGPTFAQALRSASGAAYQAVMRPVEGTILTVARGRRGGRGHGGGHARCRPAGGGGGRPRGGRGPRQDPELLPVLAEAGVVDAGGAGLVLLLDVVLHVVDGRPVPEPTVGEGVIRADAHLVQRGPTSTTPTTACPTCATRSCTSSRRPTRPSPASRTCGPASATRSWSWVATASGTATSTPTTSAPPSRPRSTPAAPARSGSPTSWSRSRRSAGCARRAASPWSRSPRTSPSRSPPRWLPWPPATASSASSTAWACRASWPAASR